MTASDLPPRRVGAAASTGLAVLCFVLGGLVFYREIWLSRFDVVFGDDGDARLAMLLMEHWLRVLSGRASFFSPIFFYPYPGVIGFTDANFLFGLLYSLGRVAGLSIYGAFQLVVIGWGAIGFASMFWLLRTVLRGNLAVCLVWSALFAFSNLNALQVGHMQLLIVASVPLLLGCLLRLKDDLHAGQPIRFWPAATLAVLYPLMAFTGFYVCWFFALFVGTALIVTAIVARQRLRIRAWRVNRWRIAVAFTAALFAAVPFAVAYVPQLLHNPGFTVDPLFLSTFPHPRDLINVGSDNLVWGRLMTWLIPDLWSRLGAYELVMGTPPGILLVFAVATVFALHAAWRGKGTLPAILAVSVWLGLLLITNFHGHSAWWAVRQIIPGARSIRVVSRYQVVLYAMALVASAPIVSLWVDRLRRPSGAALAVAAAAFLLLEQIQPTFARLRKSTDTARLDGVPPPPSACRFFVRAPIASTGDHDAFVRREQVDAIYQAMRFDIPTVNGLSSLNPPGYWFYDINQPFYAYEAGVWMARYGLTDGACILDPVAGTWTPVSRDTASLADGSNFLEPPPTERTVSSGMRVAEEGFVGPLPTPWTGSDAKWSFSVPQHASALRIDFVVGDRNGSDVTILLDDVVVQQAHVAPGVVQFRFSLASPLRRIVIRSSTFRPSVQTKSTDTRDLGILINAMVLEP